MKPKILFILLVQKQVKTGKLVMEKQSLIEKKDQYTYMRNEIMQKITIKLLITITLEKYIIKMNIQIQT